MLSFKTFLLKVFWCYLFFKKGNENFKHKLTTNKFSNTTTIGGNGVGRGGNRSADNDVVGADAFSLGRSHNALLVANVTVGKANTGSDCEKVFTAGGVNKSCFKRGADNTVKTAASRVLSVF